MKKSFEEITKKILEDYKELFQSLSTKDTLEWDITSYILSHKDAIKSSVPLYSSELYPKEYIEEQYALSINNAIRQAIQQAFNLDAETLLSRITDEFISDLEKKILNNSE